MNLDHPHTQLHDEVIMPDGRPLFAWRNELEMFRQDGRNIQAAKANAAHLMEILDVISIEQTREPHTGDYLIRVRRGDLMSSITDQDALSKAEITRLPHHGPCCQNIANDVGEACDCDYHPDPA